MCIATANAATSCMRKTIMKRGNIFLDSAIKPCDNKNDEKKSSRSFQSASFYSLL